jgi:hypothetical protein
MFTMLAVLVYLLAIGIPLFLLYFYRSQSWYWHVLAILAALGLGFVPTPAGWKTAGFDLGIGFVFILLLVWGVGGLVVFRSHKERHA